MDHKLLSIYLNDHLLGATAGVELAKRSRSSNSATELGAHLDNLAAEIEEDRAALLAMMDRLDVRRDRVKDVLGWVGEKVGRLKLNGSLLSYSPLSRAVELEGLTIGLTAKRSAWQVLSRMAPNEPRLDQAELEALLARAERQLAELEERRLDAVVEALS